MALPGLKGMLRIGVLGFSIWLHGDTDGTYYVNPGSARSPPPITLTELRVSSRRISGKGRYQYIPPALAMAFSTHLMKQEIEGGFKGWSRGGVVPENRSVDPAVFFAVFFCGWTPCHAATSCKLASRHASFAV